MILILIFSAALEEAVVATKREQHTWVDLEHKLAPEVFRAPKTCGDPNGMGAWPGVDSRIISYLEYSVFGRPWMNHLALVALVLTARRRDASTILGILSELNCRFKVLFPALHLTVMDEWKADTHICAYLRGEVRPEDTDTTRVYFYKAYTGGTKQLQSWLRTLPEDVRASYQQFILPPVTPGLVTGLDKRKEVEEKQRQIRKAETDAVVPQFSALRVEAHLRYNRMLRLRQAYQQALSKVLPDHSNLPLDFSYDEGDPPQERLFFRVWDRRTFTLAHDYLAGPKKRAERGMYTCSQEKNGIFLEFVKAERLVGDAPAEGLWFTELLKMDVLGQTHCKKHLTTKLTWLEAWGYRDPNTQKGTSPFWTKVAGLLAWPAAGGDSAFMARAQEKAKGVLVPVEELYTAATFGLLATDLFTTTGMRSNEGMQVRLSPDCFVRLVMNAPPGAKDQSPRVRFAFRLIPKGERTETPQDYFIGEETKRILVKVAQMVAESYHLRAGETLPCVPFDPGNRRSHRFGLAPYLFQYNRQHLPGDAIAACIRFLLHGMVFQTREGKRVVLKPHLLRHSFATHAVQVEKIPLDIVGEWLKQKSLDVTDYYSQPTESMVAEVVDLYLARVSASVHIGQAVQRSPQELQQLYNEAKNKAGTLADVIGGQCVSHGFCAAKFACVGCPGKVPDPAKRLQLERHKVWAMTQVAYATQEGLLPESERMKQLARDCETELQEIDQIEAYRKDEERRVQLRIQPRA